MSRYDPRFPEFFDRAFKVSPGGLLRAFVGFGSDYVFRRESSHGKTMAPKNTLTAHEDFMWGASVQSGVKLLFGMAVSLSSFYIGNAYNIKELEVISMAFASHASFVFARELGSLENAGRIVIKKFGRYFND